MDDNIQVNSQTPIGGMGIENLSMDWGVIVDDLSIPVPESYIESTNLTEEIIHADTIPVQEPEPIEEATVFTPEEPAPVEERPVFTPLDAAAVEEPPVFTLPEDDAIEEVLVFVPLDSDPVEEPPPAPPVELQIDPEPVELPVPEDPPDAPVLESAIAEDPAIPVPQPSMPHETPPDTYIPPAPDDYEPSIPRQTTDGPTGIETQAEAHERPDDEQAATNKEEHGLDFENSTVIAEIWAERNSNEGGMFTGIVYIAGHPVTVTGTPAAWIRVSVSAGTAVYTSSTPPDPFPDDEEWFETASTYGDIHVDRM